MLIKRRQLQEAMQIASDILEPVGCTCFQISSQRHAIMQVVHNATGSRYRIVFAKSPRTGFDNLKDWVRQDANRLRRKIEGASK